MKLLILMGILLFCCVPLSGIAEETATDSISASELESGIYPKYPLDTNITWIGNISLEAGYPLVDHVFAPFSEEEWTRFDIGKQHVIRIIPYANSPLFPDKTVYAIYHEKIETMPWLIEMKNPITGDDMLAQVASTPKGKYNPNLSAKENDMNNNIGWYVIDGKLYPRTWVSGHLKEGQTWVENWGPYDPDLNGSVLRKRTYTIHEIPVEFAGQTYPGYLVHIAGPHVIAKVPVETVEDLTLIDGIGVTSRLLTHTATEPFISNSSITGKKTMPAGTMIFRHNVTMNSMSVGESVE